MFVVLVGVCGTDGDADSPPANPAMHHEVQGQEFQALNRKPRSNMLMIFDRA